MRRFYVFKRGEIYYAQLRNPETNTLCTARSTGATALEDAHLVIADWLANGLPGPGGKGRRSTKTFLSLDAILRSLRAPKNGEERVVPLLPELRDELVRLAETNPHRLKQALLRLTVGNAPSAEEKAAAEAAWKERNIVFHSWRHFYAAHATEEDFKKMGKATKRILLVL